MERFFKGWAKPGPIPNPDNQNEVPPGETLDSLSGHFRIFQLEDGHRYSTDDVLTAWYGTQSCPSARKVLDLGSGIGTVGMLTAWRLQGATFVTIEAQEESVRLARKSIKLNGLEDRYEIRQGDFREEDALAPEERFDLILGSPPYFPIGSGILGNHPQKVACRFELRGSIHDYCKTAAKHLDWGGVFSCVFPISPSNQAQRVVDAAKNAGLCIIKQRNVVFREGDEPLIGLFIMMHSDQVPAHISGRTFLESPLTIRDSKGQATHEYLLVKMTMGLPPTN